MLSVNLQPTRFLQGMVGKNDAATWCLGLQRRKWHRALRGMNCRALPPPKSTAIYLKDCLISTFMETFLPVTQAFGK